MRLLLYPAFSHGGGAAGGRFKMESFINDQSFRQLARGSYGPLGSEARNGCGAIAVHNLLVGMGEKSGYEEIRGHFCRRWNRATLCGGIFGTRISYLREYLRGRGYATAVYKRADKLPGEARGFLIRYFYRKKGFPFLCGHYKAVIRERDGRLHTYNPEAVYRDMGEFLAGEKAVRWGLAVLAVEKRGLKEASKHRSLAAQGPADRAQRKSCSKS